MDWMTIREATARYGVSVKTVRRALSAGELDGRRTGPGPRDPWEISAESLEARFATPAKVTAKRRKESNMVPVEDYREMKRDWQEAMREISVLKATTEVQRFRLDDARSEVELLRTRHGNEEARLRSEAEQIRQERDQLRREAEYLRTRRWWQSKTPPPE